TVMLDRYNLTHVADNLGSQLSGGERRRLEMARTLVPEPQVLLLDEPFAGVDPIAVAEIKGFIQAVRDAGIGVLLTDHNVRETLGICDRAYLISEGRILMTGTPQEIVDNAEARRTYLGEDFKL
ncbi:MAG TPA: ATP-binding cassette domain-containing protein, partial [Myxococcota bacterium]|nr:ATP-binding cassette domain-containing protein [Myxococcota bacterium]